MKPRNLCALSFAVCAALPSRGAIAQTAPEIVAKLDAAKARVSQAVVRGRVRTSRIYGKQVERTTYTWAFSHGKERLEETSGSNNNKSGLEPGEVMVWDGERSYTRSPSRNLSGSEVGALVSVGTSRSPFDLSPLRAGYQAFDLGSERASGWLADLIHHVSFLAKTTPDGNIILSFSPGLGGEQRLVTLSPKWDFMVVRDRRYTPGPYRTGMGGRVGILMDDRQVTDARRIGGCWIPVKFESLQFLGMRSPANPGVRLTFELEGISEDVPESMFARPGRPGDRAYDAKSLYVIDAKGRWIRTGAAPTGEITTQRPVSSKAATEEEPGGDPSKVRTVAVVILAVIVAGSVAYFIRGRRRKPDDWGPSGGRA
ncbi:MAG TPA: hypothetical protein VKT78_01100 [Fimbriimonadaceae bacterium]|nr:hypothetical protein [Fimbriimonadaceae bacterium]